MSKVDALRALREARYARIASAAPPKATSVPRKAAAPAATRTPAVTEPQPAVAEATCGHRNMSGRACTREADHLKAGTKNHRYS